MVDFTMPQLGETVTEGTVTRWLKAVGDEVALDEALVEVSTEKVDSELPSPVAGTITEIVVAEGETVDIGTVLVRIEAGDEAPETGPVAESPDSVPQGAAVATAGTGSILSPTPTRRSASTGGPVAGRLSPAVRRLAAVHGLDLGRVNGTGAGGRITARDVEAVVGNGRTGRADPPLRPAAAVAQVRLPPDRPGDVVEAFTPMRRAIAEHMVRSLATSAHTLVVMEVDYHGVETVRDRHKAEFAESHGARLTYLPFIARAVTWAIEQYPKVNASVVDDSLRIHSDVNLGVAVDLDHEGLIVPNIHEAQTLTLTELTVRMHELSERARSRRLAHRDVEGGTFTLTNAGGYGTLLTAPVINQPEIAILSTDGIKVQPVAVPDGGGDYVLGFHPIGNLALSFDHRAIDGAYASAFLAAVRDRLQDHDWESEL